MTNENIKEVFKEYLAKSEVQHALLINGSWGSGKTFFWKRELAPLATAAKYKVVYISLNGLRKIEALEHLMFLRMLPYLSSDEKGRKNNIATILGNVANAASKHFLKASLSDVVKGASLDVFDYKHTLVCFDDLERCQIPIKETLGYINDFVEHRNLKTVIIADEPKIGMKAEEKDIYSNIKEKLIGRVLNFSVDLDKVLPNLYGRYENNPNYLSFLLGNERHITTFINKHHQNNLRIISFFLDILEQIYPLVKDEPKATIDRVLDFSASICFEFKAGRLQSSDYKNYNGIDDLSAYFYSGILEDREKETPEPSEQSFDEHYYNKYIEPDLSAYYFFPSIYSYVLSGYFDRAAFLAELSSLQPEVVPAHEVDFTRLINFHFRNMDDSEFDALVERVKHYAEQGLYSIYNYVQIADFYFFFSDNGLIADDYNEIWEFLRKGLRIAEQRAVVDLRTYENLMHFRKDNPETEKVKVEMALIHKSILRSQDAEKAIDLVKIIANNDMAIIESLFEQNRFTESFLPSINMQALAEILYNGLNANIPILERIFASRYNSSNIGEFLPGDIAPLQQLELELDRLLKSQPTEKLKRFNLAGLLKTVAESYQKLEATRKR